MEITRNVYEIAPADRQALEHMLGLPLSDHQQVVLRIIGQPESHPQQNDSDQSVADDDTLPDWCNVFEGLSDAEIASIEEVMLTRADLTRPAE